MRFAIIGKPKAGKTTLAMYLSEIFKIGYCNTSDWLIEVEKRRRRRLRELGIQEAFTSDTTKDVDRPFYIALGDAVCSMRPEFLIEEAFKRASIITGIRRREEFERLPKDVTSILVVRPSVNLTDNFDITSGTTYTVVNDGTLEDLKVKTRMLADEIIGKIIKSYGHS